MPNIYSTHSYKGCTIEIHYDPDPCDPCKEWDLACRIATWHRRYRMGHEQPGGNPAEFEAALPKGTVTVPIYMYNHSGLAISTSPFSCPWDSGQLGIAYMTPDKIESECAGDSTVAKEFAARQLIAAEIKTWGAYVSGDVFGYVSRDADGEEIDSCWGYYGTDEVKFSDDPEKRGYCIQCAMDAIDHHLKAAEKLEAETAIAECMP